MHPIDWILLIIPLFIALLGGQVTIMVTDCVQGMLSYPMYMVIVAYFIYRFSWSGEMALVLMACAPGESLANEILLTGMRGFDTAILLCCIRSGSGILWLRLFSLPLTEMITSWSGTLFKNPVQNMSTLVPSITPKEERLETRCSLLPGLLGARRGDGCGLFPPWAERRL